MRDLIKIAAAASFLAAPGQAADLQGGIGELRAGAFVGTRVRLPFGAKVPAHTEVALAVAPTQSYRSASGRTMTRLGEGVALNFAGQVPNLTIGGVPAGAAIGLRQQGGVEAKRKLGLSTGVWIGIGALVAVAAVVAVTQLTCIGRDREFCGSD